MSITRRRTRHAQGFAIILVLLLMFLMLMLTLTYLRTLRVYSTQTPSINTNINGVLQGVALDLSQMIGKDGKLDECEPQDYPWTCARYNASCRLSYPYAVSSSASLGDPLVDDSWLAPLEVDANGHWSQVSNIRGSFLVYADAKFLTVGLNPITREKAPMDAPAGAAIPGVAMNGSGTPQFVKFQDLDPADPRLVDADGDKVNDALFFYPNNSLQGGTRYVAAVRVLDLSGMLNLNTALGEFAGAPGTTGPGGTTKTPRKGEGPYEVNASSLVGGPMPTDSKNFRQNLQDASTVASGRAPGQWSDWDYWWASGARTGTDGQSYLGVTNRYDIECEKQLRDGLKNYASALPAPTLFADYPALQASANRKYITTFSGVSDVCAPLPYVNAAGRDSAASGASFAKGAGRWRAFDLFNQQFNRSTPAPPSDYPAISGNTWSWHGKWSDICHVYGTGTYGITDYLQGIDNANPQTAYPYPAGPAFLLAQTTAPDRALQYQMQMGMASVSDALGRDNQPTITPASSTATTGSWMGWKPLPILTEFYAQMPYYICGGSHAPTTKGSTLGRYSAIYINTTLNRNAPAGTANPSWNTDYAGPTAAGIGSYALELVNPYQIPIRLTNVQFIFRSADGALDFDGQSPSASQDLSAYVNNAPPTGMAQDAEGYYVLRPGEKIIFYRNGTGAAGSPGFGGQPNLVAAGIVPPATSGVYTVDLGVATSGALAAPDINGHYNNRNLENIELRTMTKSPTGAAVKWINYCRLQYQSMPSGYPSFSFICENEIPAGRKGAAGDLVYRQLDVRTFGVNEKLNLLQARPAVADRILDANQAFLIKDWGDCEYRTNAYAAVSAGLLTNRPGSLLPPLNDVPASWWPTKPSPGYAHVHTQGTTLGPSNQWMKYQTTGGIHALGQSSKVVFPTPTDVPLNVIYGGARQNIKNEPAAWWNYVGIPGDAMYPGTFPELTAAGNANRTLRDNPAAGAGSERRDGLRPLDLLKVPLIGPVVHESGTDGNSNYRGGSGWGTYNAVPTLNQLTTHHDQRSIGDAVNFFLAKDSAVNGGAKSGLRGLALRTDVAWFDWVNAAAKYPSLGTLPTAAGQEYLFDGDIYISQGAGPWPTPNPTLGTGNVGSDKAWGYSNGPYARASQFWQTSWGEILTSRWQVDSPKYKGNTGYNSDDFKPGTINLNTAPKAVLKCLSLPFQPGTATPVDADLVADAIIASRQAPTAGAAVAGGVRQGLVLQSEAFGPKGLKSYSSDTTLPAKFYTNDRNLNLETLSWLPQQTSCRSDCFVAYILVQGYMAEDFTRGPTEVKRAIAIYKRDTSGNAATIVGGLYVVPAH